MESEKDSKNVVIECENLVPMDTLVERLKYDWGGDDEICVEFGVMAEPKMAFSLLPGEHQDIRVDVNILLDNGMSGLPLPMSASAEGHRKQSSALRTKLVFERSCAL